MTKKELVEELARTSGLRPREARAVVDSLLRVVERALTEGEPVTLRGFGRFDVRSRSGRIVRPPGSAREVQVPARLTPVFHCAADLSRRVARGLPERNMKRKPGRRPGVGGTGR